MKRLLNYIPIHMQDDFIRYVSVQYKMSPEDIESSDKLSSIAGEYLFKEKTRSKHSPVKKVKTEKEVFSDICSKKFSDVRWKDVTDISHSKVSVKDSVTQVYALDIMYGDKLYKRLVMRDYEKSLRFMGHVSAIWFSPYGQID